jgi:hypothetical protein
MKRKKKGRHFSPMNRQAVLSKTKPVDLFPEEVVPYIRQQAYSVHANIPRVAQRAASQEISGSPGCFTHTAPLLLASWAEFQDRIRPIAETLSGAVLAR